MQSRIRDKKLYSPYESELWRRIQDSFGYNIFGLLNKYNKSTKYASSLECLQLVDDEPELEWRYTYNPFNEREQKKMVIAPFDNSNGKAYPWVYYQLGADNKQYTVYNGMQFKDDVFSIGNGQYCSILWSQKLMMYPVEHNIYGADGKIDFAYKLNSEGNWVKKYNIHDHLGNIITTLNQSLQIENTYRYEAYGKQIPTTETTKDRLSFISKENDNESELGDFGVRKYDETIGRFTSTDPLFEKYVGWTPYQYCGNNPVSKLDPSGFASYSDKNGNILGSDGNLETKKMFNLHQRMRMKNLL